MPIGSYAIGTRGIGENTVDAIAAASALTIAPSGIASAEAFGTATVATGAATIAPTGIPSAEAFGTATVTTGGLTIAPTGIPSAEAFGTPALTLSGVITPAGIPTAEAFGVATISLGTPPGSNWSSDPAMPTGLSFPGHCVDSLGRIYVAGGLDGTARKRVNRFDPATNTWTALTDMNNIRYEHGLVCLSNDHVVAIGGYDATSSLTTVEDYNPATNTWTTIAPLPSARRLAGVVVTADDDIYVAGGYNTAGGGGAANYTSTLFRLRAGAWTTMTGFVTGRFDHACALDETDPLLPKIVVAGGVDSTGFEHDTVERYDIATDTWTTLGPLSDGRRTMSVVTDAANGIAYLIGGQASSAYTTITESIDITAGVVTLLDPMAVPRVGGAVAIDLQGRPIIAGGVNSVGVGYIDTSERYDPVTGNWTTLDDLVYAHVQHGGEYTDQRMHIFGGAAVDLVDFDPIISDGTYAQSISLPSTAPEGPPVDEGGGPGASSGSGAPTAGFIPITNFG